MRAYHPVDVRTADDAPRPSKARAARPMPSRPAAKLQPAPEPPEVVAQIPNLANPSSAEDPETDAGLPETAGRNFGWPLEVLVGGVVLLSVIVLRPVVWPLIAGSKSKPSEPADPSPRWPALPAVAAAPGSNASASKRDALGDPSALWPQESTPTRPDQRATLRPDDSREINADPWANAPAAPPSHDPMPWRTQAERFSADPAVRPATGDSNGPSGPDYRTASRLPYADDPRLAGRDDFRGDRTGIPASDDYPRFANTPTPLPNRPATNYQSAPPTGRPAAAAPFVGLPNRADAGSESRRDSAPASDSRRDYTWGDPRRDSATPSDPRRDAATPRWDYPSTGAAPRWPNSPTDQTGREPPATSATQQQQPWRQNPGFGNGNPVVDPGVARLEGTIERPNDQVPYERTRSSVY